MHVNYCFIDVITAAGNHYWLLFCPFNPIDNEHKNLQATNGNINHEQNLGHCISCN